MAASSRNAHSAPRDPDAFGLGLLYAVVFVEIGIAMPFMPIWLNSLGLDARAIGALVALPIAIRVFATSHLMGLIDRGVGPRTIVLVGSVVIGLTYALMPAGAAVGWPILVGLIALNAVASAPLVASIDFMTLAAVRRSSRLDYARIRLCGSVAFLLANIAGGALLGAMGDRLAVPFLLTSLSALAAMVAFLYRDIDGGTVPTAPAGPRPPLPNKLRLFIAATAVTQATHAAIFSFSGIYWTSNGISNGWIGTLWAIGVAAEIVLFAGISRVPMRWRTPYRLITLGAGAALVRSIGMALLGASLAALPALQALHALTFGATQLGAMAAVSALAPDGARGFAQGTIAASTALASSIAMLACGFVYDAAGGPATFLLMAPFALAGLTFATLAERVGSGDRSTRDDGVAGCDEMNDHAAAEGSRTERVSRAEG